MNRNVTQIIEARGYEARVREDASAEPRTAQVPRRDALRANARRLAAEYPTHSPARRAAGHSVPRYCLSSMCGRPSLVLLLSFRFCFYFFSTSSSTSSSSSFLLSLRVLVHVSLSIGC